MKSRINLLEQLKSLPYLSKKTVFQLGKQLGLTDASVDTYISRFLKSKEIFPLKNGLYVTADYFNNNKAEISYPLYLANILRSPSYVSSWAALQYYNLTTEAIHSITSVTPKVSRVYKTKVGNFAYQSIKKELFTDFTLIKAKFDFFLARPSKALFDLLYFKTFQFRGVHLNDIEKIIEGLRIDIEEMDKDERTKFNLMIKKYLS